MPHFQVQRLRNLPLDFLVGHSITRVSKTEFSVYIKYAQRQLPHAERATHQKNGQSIEIRIPTTLPVSYNFGKKRYSSVSPAKYASISATPAAHTSHSVTASTPIYPLIHSSSAVGIIVQIEHCVCGVKSSIQYLYNIYNSVTCQRPSILS